VTAGETDPPTSVPVVEGRPETAVGAQDAGLAAVRAEVRLGGPTQPGAELPRDRDLILERVIFFSDAVFAIAITLLVVNLRPPDIATADLDARLWDAIAQGSGQILAFFLGFTVIGLYWASHLRMFRAVQHTNRTLIWLNLGFLFWVVLMPYPTQILGGHDPTRATVVLYAAVQLCASITQLGVWQYVARHPELRHAAVDPELGRYVTLQLSRTPVVFALSIPVTLVAGPWVGIASWCVIFVGGALIGRLNPSMRKWG
jgi:TMEM175 potassium channel family protein